jgi:hypothetical protein
MMSSSSNTTEMMDRALSATRLLLPLGLGGAALGVQLSSGGEPALGVIAMLAGGTLGLFFHLFLSSLASLLGRAPLPLSGVEARSQLERDKRLVLRSLKDLELDVQLRRLGEHEATELAQPLRERAIRILRELDELKVADSEQRDPLQAEIERAVSRRVAELAAEARDRDGEGVEDDEEVEDGEKVEDGDSDDERAGGAA